MAVVLYDDIGMFLLDGANDGAQHCRTAYASHILKADFLCAALDELLGQVDVILGVVYL